MSTRNPGLLLFAALFLGSLLAGWGPAAAQEDDSAPYIRNPYHQKTEWRVWRDDESPIENVPTLIRDGKEKKVVPTTLAPKEQGARRYPVDPPKGRFLAYGPLPQASEKYAGIWDDVYTSWCGLHGYVRNRWRGPGGESAEVLNHIIHFVDVTKRFTTVAGVNFIHQSTTGQGHAITNGYSQKRTEQFERLYFADVLFTGPAHASWTDRKADRTTDLYMALFPVIFNSVGSSNSETMAITKMILAGGYLPPETKLTLKRNGLYPAAMLYLWKASLPYPYPYDHELRHRIAYKSVGDRTKFPEKYSAAAIDRGDLSLPYHCYDDAAHMQNMVEMAKSMTVPMPEAIFKVVGIGGGKTVFALRKSILVTQEEGQDVTIRVSTEDCYDLTGRPLTVRFKLLCGNRATTVEREGDGPEVTVTVPWDGALPQGRTSVALIANNGLFDSNPAVINVYRKKGEIPGNGMGPGDYKYPGKFANLRPVILGLQDQVVKPGATVRIPLDAIDPEGFPVRFYQRGCQVGEIEGNHFVWKCPAGTPEGTHPVTIIASDGTSGASYAGKTIHLEVAPKIFAHITADTLCGPAPLTVKVTAEGSFDRGGSMKCGWEFYAPAHKRKVRAFKDQLHGSSGTHTFKKPGLYEIALSVEGSSGKDTESLSVYVTSGPLRIRPAEISVEGNDATVPPGVETVRLFDHTDFGAVAGGESALRTFRVVNLGDEPLTIEGRKAIGIEGPHAAEFEVVGRPRETIEARGSSLLRIRFEPVGAAERRAVVVIRGGEKPFTFAIGGTGQIDQEALDRVAKPALTKAKKLMADERWEKALEALSKFIAKHPGSSFVEEAKALITKIETDPAIQEAIRVAGEAKAAAAERDKDERRAKSLWTMAENYRKNGRADLAKKNLEKLIRDYPETTWATKAKEALSR